MLVHHRVPATGRISASWCAARNWNARCRRMESALALELAHGYVHPIQVDSNSRPAGRGGRGHAGQAWHGGPHLHGDFAGAGEYHRHRARVERDSPSPWWCGGTAWKRPCARCTPSAAWACVLRFRCFRNCRARSRIRARCRNRRNRRHASHGSAARYCRPAADRPGSGAAFSLYWGFPPFEYRSSLRNV